MDRQAIMSRALRHGFTLRQQPGGEMDLNEYVYAFAREVFEAGRLAGVVASRIYAGAGHARQQEAAESIGLRDCHSSRTKNYDPDPCSYRMRTTDPGCTGCADRDEDQSTEAGG